MLTGIILKDYTTFIERTIFDFKATNYRILEETNVGSNRILKGALLVGENASGKTQLLHSILLLLNLLLENAEQNFITKKSMYTKGTKYSLSFSFCVQGHSILYEVTFDGNNIEIERLLIDNVLKLDRLNNSGLTNFGEEKNTKDISDNLSLVKLEYYNTRFNGDPILNEWFNFLKNSIYINCLKQQIISYNPSRISEQSIIDYAKKEDEKKLNDLINKIGYNSEIVFRKQSFNIDSSIVIQSDKEIIGLKKKGTDFVMPLPLESAGNQSFVHCILPIYFATKNNCMLIIDEFSSGLHNELEEALIKYFFNNSKDSQLFFTSHSTNLLDNSILRPDQIYSFEFSAKKGTMVKRFSDENPRESQNLEKMYLNGVFNGLPTYNKEFKDK